MRIERRHDLILDESEAVAVLNLIGYTGLKMRKEIGMLEHESIRLSSMHKSICEGLGLKDEERV